MILVSYLKDGHEQLAFLEGNFLYDADSVHPELPSSMSMMLTYWDDYFPLAQALNESIKLGKISANKGVPYESVGKLSPVPQPASFRQSYAFGPQDTIPEINTHRGEGRFPLFNFGNHHCLQTPGMVHCMPDHLTKLDFSLQMAVVISRFARNVAADEADDYIAGFMIMNTLNAVDVDMENTDPVLSLSTANAFAITSGPWLVTPDELEPFKVDTPAGHIGNSYNLSMTCSVNNELVCETNSSGMVWTFAEIVERCSYGVDLYPGDIIGSGKPGNGSFLDLNRKGMSDNLEDNKRWLQAGDTIDMEIEMLGKLTTAIVADESEYSLRNRSGHQ